ncbi:YtxH domain-containing protein [Armatimonas sp.]|uniref:YtxH domain-containing protein n=1 Tax=Armatimonas sp. TaxID=1872638 RepID=UPI00286B5A4C|nr:YtxH domain-containing protein [Armatimonas sp.]
MANNKSDFLVGLLIGGALGAALALLYAPQSGEETRGKLKEKGGEFKEKTTETYDKARTKATEVGGTLKEKTTTIASSVKESASSVAARIGKRGEAAGAVEPEAAGA